MNRLTKTVCMILAGVGLSGCELFAPDPPPADLLNRGMTEALLDTGFYSKAAIGKILGQHYNPSNRTWTVFGCFEFVSQSNEQGSTCVDSFQAVELTNDTWVVAVTIEGVYRWRALSTAEASPETPSPRGSSNPS